MTSDNDTGPSPADNPDIDWTEFSDPVDPTDPGHPGGPTSDDPILGSLVRFPYSTFHDLWKGMTLQEEDRKKLREERGFTDAMIDAAGLRSAGVAVKDVVKRLRGREGKLDDLLTLGVLLPSKQKKTEKWHDDYYVNLQLIEDGNILIPYFHKDKVVVLRPHKKGLKGLPPQVYVPVNTEKLLAEGKTTIILAESEFKAIAAADGFGYPALGVPGIATFGGTHFPRLLASLDELRSKSQREDLELEVVILFDQEEKTIPGRPNFKSNLFVAHDTPYWAYKTAFALIKAGIPARVGTLPAEWMENGKIDLDGALAAGRTAAEIDGVVASALPPAKFLTSLPAATQKIIKTKLKVRSSEVQRHDDPPHYVAKKQTWVGFGDGGYVESLTRVSNFTLDFLETRQESPDAPISYFVNVTTEATSRRVPFSPEHQMLSQFKPWVTGVVPGAFWTGNQAQLDAVINDEMDLTALTVYEPPVCGYLAEHGLYALGNCVVKNGHLFTSPKPGEPIHVENCGFRVQPIDGDPASLPLAVLPVEGNFETQLDSTEFLKAMEAAYPDLGQQITLTLGWFLASLIRHTMKGDRQFPSLQVDGPTESGKSTYIRIFRSICFVPFEFALTNVLDSSMPSIHRSLAYFSDLPFVMDEFRSSDPKARELAALLRNVADGNESGRALLGSKFNDRRPVRAGAVLIGEDAPVDESTASESRVIDIRFSGPPQGTHDAMTKVQKWAKSGRLSAIGRDFLIAVTREKCSLLPLLQNAMEGWTKSLLEAGVTNRLASLYAIPAACVSSFVYPGLENAQRVRAFREWLIGHVKGKQARHSKRDTVTKFVGELASFPRDVIRSVLDVATFRPKGEAKGMGEQKAIFLALTNAYDLIEKRRVDLRREKGFTEDRIRRDFTALKPLATGSESQHRYPEVSPRRLQETYSSGRYIMRPEPPTKRNKKGLVFAYDKAPPELRELADDVMRDDDPHAADEAPGAGVTQGELDAPI